MGLSSCVVFVELSEAEKPPDGDAIRKASRETWPGIHGGYNR